MPLARTPPQRVQPLPQSDMADTTLPSPSRAFGTRNPGVVRSPIQGGVAAPPAESFQGESSTSRPPSNTPSKQTDYLQQPMNFAQPETLDEIHPEPAHLDDPMDIDPEPPVSISTTPSAPLPEPYTPLTPPPEPSTVPLSLPNPTANTPVTPARRKSRANHQKTPAEVLAEPSEPIHDIDAERAEFGKRYKVTVDTLELAVKAGAMRWT